MKESRELIKRSPEDRDLSRPDDALPVAPVPQSLPPSYASYGVENTGDAEVHLREYWLAVRKRLWLVAGIVALVTVLSAIYMARKPDIYEAESRVQVDLERNNPAVGAMTKGNSI